MSDRKREVATDSFIYFVCDVHGWDYTEIDGEDVCPVCYGESLAEARIIKLLEDPENLNRWWGNPDKNLGLYGNLAKYVIALIKEGK